MRDDRAVADQVERLRRGGAAIAGEHRGRRRTRARAPRRRQLARDAEALAARGPAQQRARQEDRDQGMRGAPAGEHVGHVGHQQEEGRHQGPADRGDGGRDRERAEAREEHELQRGRPRGRGRCPPRTPRPPPQSGPPRARRPAPDRRGGACRLGGPPPARQSSSSGGSVRRRAPGPAERRAWMGGASRFGAVRLLPGAGWPCQASAAPVRAAGALAEHPAVADRSFAAPSGARTGLVGVVRPRSARSGSEPHGRHATSAPALGARREPLAPARARHVRRLAPPSPRRPGGGRGGSRVSGSVFARARAGRSPPRLRATARPPPAQPRAPCPPAGPGSRPGDRSARCRRRRDRCSGARARTPSSSRPRRSAPRARNRRRAGPPPPGRVRSRSSRSACCPAPRTDSTE